MSRTRRVLVRAPVALLGLVLLLAAAAGRAADLEAALQRFEHSAAVRGARLGVLVADLDSGETLAAQDAATPLVPASSQKLLVASTALERWGPAHRFSTPIYVEGALDDKGVLAGRLWIAGRGDPSLVSESLWRLAEEIRLRGIREIQGGLGIDASYFDRVQIHPDWEPVSTRAYHSPISAWAANYSSFRIEVTPGEKPEAPVAVAVAPATRYFRIDSRALTVARGGRIQLGTDDLADGSGERVAVAGSLALRAGSSTYWRSVASPELYAASILKMQLEAQGVRVAGGTVLGTLPADAREFLRFEGDPLALVIRNLNKYSNNFIAEQLTKALGAEREGPPGTWEKGRAVIQAHLESLGLVDPGAVLVDGSGLSPRNRVSARMLVGVIRHAVTQSAWAPEFLASLPLSGRDGTLEDRFVESASLIRGKTGHLRNVASLVGIVTPATGRPLVFAVIVNGARSNPQDVDQAIDAFVTSLRESTPKPAPE